MLGTLQQMVKTHFAIVAMLDSETLSPEARRQLETFRDDLEEAIDELNSSKVIEYQEAA
jgi:hypothetical protein